MKFRQTLVSVIVVFLASSAMAEDAREEAVDLAVCLNNHGRAIVEVQKLKVAEPYVIDGYSLISEACARQEAVFLRAARKAFLPDPEDIVHRFKQKSLSKN